MIKKTARVHWEGEGKKGQGQISTETGALTQYPYGFGSRFEDDRTGTNPEEILGAAHAACFTMAFSFACADAGYTTTSADTQAVVHLAKVEGGFAIDTIELHLTAKIDGISEDEFLKIAEGAKKNCPLSKALAAVPHIELKAALM